MALSINKNFNFKKTFHLVNQLQTENFNVKLFYIKDSIVIEENFSVRSSVIHLSSAPFIKKLHD
jgi:hypothetical protein